MTSTPETTPGAVTTGNALIRHEDIPGGHAYCDAEIARLHAHLETLGREHARHSVAVEAHKGRADQQESRAIRAEKQLARFATYAVQYDELAEQAALGQRNADLVTELRKRIDGMERARDRAAAVERERIAQEIRDYADHLEVHVSPNPEASRNFVAGMRRAADYAVNGPNPPMANEA